MAYGLTLADARAKRDEAKKLLVQGIDPKAEQKEVQAESAGAYTFETVARQWHASNKRWGITIDRGLSGIWKCIFSPKSAYLIFVS